MKQKGLLQQLGFSELSQQVYTILLKRGPCSIIDLATLAGKHRPAIYKVVPDLLSSGLISQYSKGKRFLYKAESPAALSTLFKIQAENVDAGITEYIKFFELRDKKPKISFFEGRQGIATMYEQFINSVKRGGIIYRYESPRDHHENKRYYPSLYWKRAGSLGDLDKYVITNSRTHKARRNSLNRLSKAVPTLDSSFEFNITQLISDEQVAFIDFDSEVAVVITDKRFASFQQSLFKLLFSRL